jgi:hypothetical protein
MADVPSGPSLDCTPHYTQIKKLKINILVRRVDGVYHLPRRVSRLIDKLEEMSMDTDSVYENVT